MARLLNLGGMQEVVCVVHEEMCHYPEVARKGRCNKKLRKWFRNQPDTIIKSENLLTYS